MATRLEPSSRGELRRTPVAHLLVYALERQLTGSFEFVVTKGEAAALRVVGGHVTKARTSEPVAPLGRVLLELGYVTRSTLDLSRITLTEEWGLHGQILRDAGAITELQLDEALRVQLSDKLGYVFTLSPRTSFAFYSGVDLLEEYGEVRSFDILPVLWRGICLSPPWEQVDATLGRIAHLAITAKPTATFERFCFEADVAGTASVLMAGTTDVGRFTRESQLSIPTARLLLYCLLITKQLAHVDPAVSSSASAPAPAAPAPEKEEDEPPTLVGRVVVSTLAERTAPPSVESPPNPRGPEPLSLSKIALGGPKATPFLSSAAVRLPQQETKPTVTAPRDSEKSVALKRPEPRGTDHEQRRAEVLEYAKRIDRLDYFDMLGVAHDAAPEAVEMAFLALAKVWHPDRLPSQLMDLVDSCTHIVARLNEAYRTLHDPLVRSKYMLLVREGGATQEYVSRVVQAAQTFQKAEFFAKREEYAKAEELCRKAQEADPTQADYLALLAWLEAMKAENQSRGKTTECISMLDRAVAVSDRCERARYYRGMLYKRLGNIPLALADFRKAVEINPRAADTQSELRLLLRRHGENPQQLSAPAQEAPKRFSGLFRLLKKD
ncbi:MAG: tetratricopeptide repeat protein [Myxococcales bacterium]